MTSIAAKIRKGSLWIAGSRAVTNALAVLSTIAMARLLLPTDFGVVAIGTAILAIVTTVSDLALSQALIQHEDPQAEHLDSAWTLNVLRGLLLGGLIAASGPLIASYYGDDRITLVMLVIAGATAIGGLENPRLAMLKRDLHFHQIFIVQTSAKLAMVLVSVSVAWLTRSHLALVAGIAASTIAQVTASYAAAPYVPRPCLKEARSLLSFSLWITMTQLVNTISLRLEPLMIGKIVGVHSLGLFTVANNLSAMPTREPTRPLANTLFPAFVRLRETPERQRQAFKRAQTLISAIALPCGILLAVLAKPLILILLGKKWIGAVFLVQVLAVAYAAGTLGTATQPLAMANGRTDLIFRRSLQAMLVRLPLVIAGLTFGGLNGFLVAFAIATAAGVMFNKLIVRQLTGFPIREQLLHNWRTIIAATVMAVLGFSITPLFDFGAGYAQLAAQVALVAMISVSANFALLFGLWFLAGRPNGPETEIVSVSGSIVRRLKRISRQTQGA